MNCPPVISVVTIAFNDREGLRATMASVFAQTYTSIEYIIVDGGSTDGSLTLIRQHAASLAQWVSEPDQGIYDAINKGTKLSTGDWIIFMNAGDDFASPTVVQEIFNKPIAADVDFIYGDRIVKYEGYEVFRPAGPISSMWRGSQFSHQSVFVRASFQRTNLYNLNNRISADFEMFFKAHVAGQKFLRLPVSISKVSSGGLSDRARLENIAAFYKVVRGLRSSPKVHLYFMSVLPLQYLKLSVKRLFPSAWITRFRRMTAKSS